MSAGYDGDLDALQSFLQEDDWLADFGRAQEDAELLLGSELRSCTSEPFLQVDQARA